MHGALTLMKDGASIILVRQNPYLISERLITLPTFEGTHEGRWISRLPSERKGKAGSRAADEAITKIMLMYRLVSDAPKN
ncbi:hypothetical protein NDU88_008122 [Pleurodeles waltl]|uniref:Uncharacterized protein n=1 Tax=Pleurodeles waltl TaxID=8319 RepID=A0AAV7N417_PLEWA|nr:hypothetical protein NDU88_008122 [Pleurodeles waltl]